MYLKTPKRYSVKRRKRYLFNFRRVAFWIIMPVLIYGLWRVYQERERFAPVVNERAGEIIAQGQSAVSTMTAPTPMPTENPQVQITRADTNWAGGRVEDAIEDYKLVIDAVPNDVVTHRNLTLGLLVDGRVNEALEASENAITADPFAADAWAIHALAQVRTGDSGGAIASGLHALNLNDSNVQALAALTEAYIALGQPERAREAAQRAIDIDPNSAAAYYARAQVYHLVDFNLEAAREDYIAAYEIAPYMMDAAVDKAFFGCQPS